MKYNLQEVQKAFDLEKSLKFLFFWGHSDNKDYITKVCLSQSYESKFIIDNNIYFTAEHFMMAEKAKLFNNDDLFQEILITEKQGKVKELGRQIKNFKQHVWDEHKYQIVIKGNFHKFSQNIKLKDFLINTNHKILVEASPLDNIWGVGLSVDDENINDPYLWNGQNLLGFALMEVRDSLKENDE